MFYQERNSIMLESFALGVLGGLLSGILVYLVRQKIRADRLRKAMAMEVRHSTPLDTLSTAFMGEGALRTPIINSNLDKIHLLTKNEIIEIANFHRHMSHVRERFEIIEEDGEEKMHIPSKLQHDSIKYARATVNELESHIICRSTLSSRVKFWSE